MTNWYGVLMCVTIHCIAPKQPLSINIITKIDIIANIIFSRSKSESLCAKQLLWSSIHARIFRITQLSCLHGACLCNEKACNWDDRHLKLKITQNSQVYGKCNPTWSPFSATVLSVGRHKLNSNLSILQWRFYSIYSNSNGNLSHALSLFFNVKETPHNVIFEIPDMNFDLTGGLSRLIFSRGDVGDGSRPQGKHACLLIFFVEKCDCLLHRASFTDGN